MSVRINLEKSIDKDQLNIYWLKYWLILTDIKLILVLVFTD